VSWSAGALTVDSPTTAHRTVTTGSTTGDVTWTDSTTGSTCVTGVGGQIFPPPVVPAAPTLWYRAKQRARQVVRRRSRR
jgi:hypothetical protein